MKNLLIILVVVGMIISIQTAYAVDIFSGDIQLNSGNSMYFVDNSTSISSTNDLGNGPGTYLNERGFSAIVFRTGGTNDFGTGDETARIEPSGFRMVSGKSFSWGTLGTSIASTNSAGTAPGAFLNERGFNGIVFRTGGSNAFGTGDEIARITPTGLGIGINPTQKLDVNGNIRLTGNILSPNDICIGSCP